MYHVINSPPAGAPFPGLYVTPDEFAEQMRALKRAGWSAVTLDQLDAYWREGVSLPAGNAASLPDSVLPLAVVSVQNGAVSWIDAYLVRRDLGPQFNGVRFGLTDPAAQQAFLLQYDTQLQTIVQARQNSGMKANFAASAGIIAESRKASPDPRDERDRGAVLAFLRRAPAVAEKFPRCGIRISALAGIAF